MVRINSGKTVNSLKLLITVVLISVVLGGCWDRQEIEQQISVIALALDQHEAGVRATIQVPIPVKIIGSGGGGGGASGQEAVQLFSATGSDLTDAFKNLQTQLNQSLRLGHMRLVVVSEELARDGLEDMVDAMGRMPEVRRRLWPMVAEGEAAKVLRASPELVEIPAVYLIDMIDNEVRQNRMFDFTFGRFNSKRLDEAEQPLLNTFSASEKTVHWTGAALFRGDHMVGKLNKNESWLLLQLRDEASGYRTNIPCPGGGVEEITFEPSSVVERTVSFFEQPLHFHLYVKLEGKIVESTCKLDLSKEDNIRAIERELKQQYEKRASDLIKKTQANNSDVVRLGTHIRAFYPGLWDRIDWDDVYPTVNVDVTYDINVTGTGAKYK